MTARNRLPPWHEQLRLPNGREVLVRPIRPDDAVPLRAGFALLEPDEIRHRFLHPRKELTVEAADRLTRPDPKREFAIVVAEPLPPGEALVGAVARVSIDDVAGGDHAHDRAGQQGLRQAEFAILVSHYIAGMGMGRHLMGRIVRWSRGKKLDCIYGDVLEQNQPMLALAKSLGFRRATSDTPGLVRVVLDLKVAKTGAVAPASPKQATPEDDAAG